MWKQVLSLTLLFCSIAVQSQVKPVPIELSPFQRGSFVRDAAVRESQVEAAIQDPHQILQRMQIANAVSERRVALRRDTEKLLSLAAELKQNVDKTGPNILSMDVIRKAQEIEELAKSVKDKMKDAY